MQCSGASCPSFNIPEARHWPAHSRLQQMSGAGAFAALNGWDMAAKSGAGGQALSRRPCRGGTTDVQHAGSWGSGRATELPGAQGDRERAQNATHTGARGCAASSKRQLRARRAQRRAARGPRQGAGQAPDGGQASRDAAQSRAPAAKASETEDDAIGPRRSNEGSGWGPTQRSPPAREQAGQVVLGGGRKCQARVGVGVRAQRAATRRGLRGKGAGEARVFVLRSLG